MNLSMFGTGYVGLVTGACFAEMGNSVLCVDIDAEKIAALQAGRMPFFEPGLERMVANNIHEERLRFCTDLRQGVEHGDLLFITVGTPPRQDGKADLGATLSVAESIGRHMATPKVVVNKSTVPVGTADMVRGKIAEALAARGLDIDFDVASNPEFLKEGAAVGDFMKPDRIIIGCEREDTLEWLQLLYAPFNRNHEKIVHMDARSAELAKYAANAMLATRISLMNELAALAERLDANIESVRRGIGMDPRIGHHFIYPGVGYGGSCFPKDMKALMHMASSAGFEAHIASSVEAVNERQKNALIDKILAHCGGDFRGRTFALWGLAFKPNTNDMREASSRVVIDRLLAGGAEVRAYDPAAGGEALRLYGDAVTVCKQRRDSLEDADGLIIMTEWNEFRSPDFQSLRAIMKHPVIFDGRNLYDPELLDQLGFAYYSIGRPPVCGGGGGGGGKEPGAIRPAEPETDGRAAALPRASHPHRRDLAAR